MTPEQIAVAALRTQELQVWITGLAIVLGPLAGVIFTLWFQQRKERRDAKRQLFLTLIGERKQVFVSREITRALNQIDVVYSDNAQVKALWHKYYRLLPHPHSQEHDHAWLELLAAMAADLKYTSVSQVDLDKVYRPRGHVDDEEQQRKIGKELLRVLESSERLAVVPRTPSE